MTKNKYSQLIIPYLSWFIALVFYLNQYFLRMSVAGLSENLMRTYHIDAISLSLIAASFYYAFVIMQLPAGYIIDRLPTNVVVAIGSSIVSLGAFLFWNASNATYLEMARAIMGFGAAFSFISILHIAKKSFSPQQFPLINGITLMVGSIASILAGAPLMQLISVVNWQVVLKALFLVGIINALVALLFIKTPTPNESINQPKEDIKPDKKPSIVRYRDVFFKKDALAPALYIGFMIAFLSDFAGLWLIPFMRAVHPNEPLWASYSSAVMLSGIGLGAVLIGLFLKYFSYIKQTMLIASLINFLLFTSLLYFAGMNLFLSYFILFLLGFSTSCANVSFNHVANKVSENVSGFAFSFVNMTKILVGALILPVIGYILSVFKLHHAISTLVGPELVESFQLALSVLSISAFMAVLCALWLYYKK